MTSSRVFRELLEERWSRKLFVCVGLDSDVDRLPASVRRGRVVGEALVAFNRALVDATCDLVGAYKPNSAFYERHGAVGWTALAETIAYIHHRVPDVPVILDAKRADIGTTSAAYAGAVFDDLAADAVTVNPYLGGLAVQPFLDRADKGIIVLCKTSNPGSGEFQDLVCDGEPLYRVVARRVAETWNMHGNCALVVGATYPREVGEVRQIVGDLPLLIPGVGAQGGEVTAVVRVGRDSCGQGILISASRSIIFASAGRDFADAARAQLVALHERIGEALV